MTPVVFMRKLRLREGSDLTNSSEWRSLDLDPGIRLQQPYSCSPFYLSPVVIKSVTCLTFPTCSSAPCSSEVMPAQARQSHSQGHGPSQSDRMAARANLGLRRDEAVGLSVAPAPAPLPVNHLSPASTHMHTQIQMACAQPVTQTGTSTRTSR